MGELTVIIPFCNEGNEVGLTIQSCLDLAEGPVEFVLINDNSTDGYDYHSVAKKYKATYIEHTKQWGVAPSREDGVAVCKTPYFLLLDAHMCMLNKG
jgi:glycosyltransferase involved in cell wall biosynthesis